MFWLVVKLSGAIILESNNVTVLQVHSRREELYYKLRSHRGFLDTEKRNHKEFQREHERLIAIGNKSDDIVVGL